MSDDPKRTTSMVVLKLEVEFDLNDVCPNEITEAVENILDTAKEHGYVQDASMTSEHPLEFGINI